MTSKAPHRPATDDRRAGVTNDKRRAREKALDKALEDTFPASDPVATTEPAPRED